ncbi:MAG: hypothetical protein ABIO55_03250 [Ginsengibacter sp.]
MMLKNIPLPPVVLANLYKHSLVENTKKKIVHQHNDINFLGGNNRHILFLVSNSGSTYLSDSELIFLSEILTACKLSLNDIAIVNLDKSDPSNQKSIPDTLKAGIVILSGIELSILQLPFNIPLFQVQQYKEKKYVTIPSLYTIQNDTALKRKLWEVLKILFSV